MNEMGMTPHPSASPTPSPQGEGKIGKWAAATPSPERIAAAAERPRNDAAIIRTPEVVGAEVRNLTAAARYLTVWYAVEIGRRLTEAKEMVAHGEWLDWLKRETEFSQPTASRFMRIYAEYGADQGNLFGAETKYSTLNNLSVSNALKLLAVPEEERESFAAEVDAEHLSTRELEQAIRERDELKQALQAAREEEEKRRAEAVAPYEARITELERAVEDAGPYRERAEAAEEEIAGLKSQLKELKEKPIDVAVQEPDPAEIERRVQAAAEQRLAEEKQKAAAAADKLKKKLEAAEEKLERAKQAELTEERRAEVVAPYEEEVAKLRKQIAMSGEAMTTFKLRFEAWQEAYAAMLRALAALDEEKAAKGLAAIQAALKAWAAA